MARTVNSRGSDVLRLNLKIVEDPTTGEGVIQVIEDKAPLQQPIIGFISFRDKETRDFYTRALTQNGAMGQVMN